MMIAVFRSRLRPEHEDEFRELGERMQALAEAMPGFVSYRVYVAEDGERCSVVEFETAEALAAWRMHPEHRRAQQLGRERFYEEYSLQVAEVARDSKFRK